MLELCNVDLIEALASALETMAFVTLSPTEGPAKPPDEAVILRIDYHGSGPGQIEMVTSRQLGRLLLDNTLGADPSDSLIMPNPDDPLVEILNVTCGTFLKARSGGRRAEMEVPTVHTFAVDQWARLVSEAKHDLLLADGIPLAVRVVEK